MSASAAVRFWGLIVAVVTCGCGGGKPLAEEWKEYQMTLRVPTGQEADTFARELEQVVRTKEAVRMEQMTNWKHLAYEILADLSCSEKYKREEFTGIIEDVADPESTRRMMSGWMGEGEVFTFRSQRLVDGRRVLLYTSIGDDLNEVSYVVFALTRDGVEGVQITNIYDSDNGQWATDIFRRTTLRSLQEDHPEEVAKLSPQDQARLEAVAKDQEMKSLLSSNPVQVLAIYDSLMPAVQEQEVIQLKRYLALASADRERFHSLNPQGGQTFPLNLGYLLIAQTTSQLNQENDRAAEALRQLRLEVGDDPSLQYREAVLLERQGDFAGAARLLETLTAPNSQWLDVYRHLICLYHHQGNDTEALKWQKLHLLHTQNVTNPTDDGVRNYMDKMLQSDRYTAWEQEVGLEKKPE